MTNGLHVHMMRPSAQSRAEKSRTLLKVLLLFIIPSAFAITPATAQETAAPRLSSAVIRGATLYDPADLFSFYRDHLGKPIDRASVSTIVTALADRYQADGYARPRITIDDELVLLGILRINVFEARIAAVKIVGDPGPHRDRLERLGAELENGEPLRQQALQDTLRRMRRLPGLTLTAATEQDADIPNVYRLDVDADYRLVGGTVRVTNRGTDDAGPHIVVGQLLANGLLGGRTSAGLMFGAATDYEEFRGLGVLASSTVGEKGASLSFNAFRSRANPSETAPDRDDLYVRDRATLRFSKPLGEASDASTFLNFTFESTDLAISRSGFLLRDERLRMLKLGLSRNWRRGTVEYVGSVELVKGLDGLNSALVAIDLVDDGRRADFLVTRLNLIRLARFAPNWSLRFDAFAQQTAYTVPYTERFKIGGERLGRGFDVASIAGDQGLGAKLELRRELPGAPRFLGNPAVYGFYDAGATWRQDAPGRDSAATAGFGFAVRDERVTAALEIARPLTHPDVEGKDDARVFFELTLRL